MYDQMVGKLQDRWSYFVFIFNRFGPAYGPWKFWIRAEIGLSHVKWNRDLHKNSSATLFLSRQINSLTLWWPLLSFRTPFWLNRSKLANCPARIQISDVNLNISEIVRRRAKRNSISDPVPVTVGTTDVWFGLPDHLDHPWPRTGPKQEVGPYLGTVRRRAKRSSISDPGPVGTTDVWLFGFEWPWKVKNQGHGMLTPYWG